MSLCEQILRVKKTTSTSKFKAELGLFPFRINIEKQMFKYFQRIPLLKEDSCLRKALNEECKTRILGGWSI